MSRPLRIDYPSAWHHVMNRARRWEDLFEEKANYQQFIDLLQETADLFHVNVSAVCLMPTISALNCNYFGTYSFSCRICLGILQTFMIYCNHANYVC